jgi:hypothetical protein
MTKSAAAAEALGEKIPFHARGVDFELAPSSEWDFDAIEAFEEGRIATFLKLILGAKQYAAFKATKPKVGDVDAFVLDLQKALGIEGN